MQAVDPFKERVKAPCIARELRVSEKSVYQWRRAWRRAGGRPCAPRGPRAATACSALSRVKIRVRATDHDVSLRDGGRPGRDRDPCGGHGSIC
ncbi:helix-turn-helix domain-containing protein [Streptomyces sp. NPDC093261]|uniref:helix-turn-helix domain-containing protein n=1 Tax=Streptomyces sp. NPDC093261 TaxID=3366037 RepID=UPI003807CE19